MILITAPLNVNHKNDDDFLLLGKWASKKKKKKFNIPHHKKYKVLSYHWISQTKLENDFYKTFDIYKKLFPILTKQMNIIHNVNYSERYWKILLGPWFILFIQTIYDRWETINYAIRNENIKGAIVYKNIKFSKCKNTRDYRSSLFSDETNNKIFSFIIKTSQI